MNRKLFRITIMSLLLTVIGCAQGNCRSHQPKSDKVSEAALNPESRNMTERVRVFKYDGSLQCGQGEAIAVEKMQLELKEIRIYSAKKAQDGLMRIQVCGAAAGKANVYEIDRSSLPEAIKRGFKEWTWD